MQIFQQDILLHIFSFLNLQTIYNLTSTSHLFNRLLSSSQADRFVYGTNVYNLFKIHLKQIINEEEFLQILQKQKSFTTYCDILKEFFLLPLKPNIYQADALERYIQKGGVADITIWKPCKLLEILYQSLFDNLSDSFIISVFKYLLILSVNEDNGSSSFNLSFELQPRPWKMFVFKFLHPPLAKKFKTLNSGQLLLHMCDNFKEFMEGKENNERVVVWNDQFELDYNLISDKYYEATSDIFIQSLDPPYGIDRNVDEEIEEIRKDLYSGECYSVDWRNCVSQETCWSYYWLAGLEWWGTYGFTTFNKLTKLFIVATASVTD
ncbi:hypothetical protein ABK040_005348 [Willaertia magna]